MGMVEVKKHQNTAEWLVEHLKSLEDTERFKALLSSANPHHALVLYGALVGYLSARTILMQTEIEVTDYREKQTIRLFLVELAGAFNGLAREIDEDLFRRTTRVD